MKAEYTTIDEYIGQHPEEIQERLKAMRELINQHAPMAKEKISWGMPTYYDQGNLVHFAAAKKHMGFYPAPETITAFEERLKDYRCSKGAVQFPYDKPLPTKLIGDMVDYRVKQAKSNL